MKEDFTINGKPAYATFGVRLGSGCIDALEAPLELKDVIENEDRRENGVRQIVRTTFKKRTVTLKLEYTERQRPSISRTRRPLKLNFTAAYIRYRLPTGLSITIWYIRGSPCLITIAITGSLVR